MNSSVKNEKKKKNIPLITIMPEAYRHYRESISQKAPETFALLGGRLDDPFHITDFRFCPPKKDRYGQYDASGSHVNVDHEYMNWVIDEIWKPNGKYMLGIWHSHPAGVTRPSYGDPKSNEGDVVFFTACMNGDDSPEQNWCNFLAPITTFGTDGKDQIHGWILSKGSDHPVKTKIQIPGPEVSVNDAFRFLKQCTYQDIKPLYHSSSLTQKMRERLICLLRLKGQNDIAERLIADFPIPPKVNILV